MELLKKQAETLNDLVLINNDRVEGYQKAMEELKDEDADLRPVFQERVDQSRKFHDELIAEVTKLGEEYATGTKTTGKIYRAWMDVKAFFSGDDKKAILDNCVDGEAAALKAYDDALECENISPEQRAIIIRHQADIKNSFDKIKAMRDIA